MLLKHLRPVGIQIGHLIHGDDREDDEVLGEPGMRFPC
jgi:hypothetical protein